jgi:hypothetical protein
MQKSRVRIQNITELDRGALRSSSVMFWGLSGLGAPHPTL